MRNGLLSHGLTLAEGGKNYSVEDIFLELLWEISELAVGEITPCREGVLACSEPRINTWQENKLTRICTTTGHLSPAETNTYTTLSALEHSHPNPWL